MKMHIARILLVFPYPIIKGELTRYGNEIKTHIKLFDVHIMTIDFN